MWNEVSNLFECSTAKRRGETDGGCTAEPATIVGLQRQRPEVFVTPSVAKHRLFVLAHPRIYFDDATVVVWRGDFATFGVLHGRCHELWSLALCTWLGVGNDPRYTPKSCFDTFPFPTGLIPADTTHQRTESLPDGAVIPADLPPTVRPHVETIARAAKHLNDLRERWLNPPEWTRREPEVVPLGMDHSPYPERILPRDGFETLDAAVAAAYGWSDYTPHLPDEEILRRLLAMNRVRSGH